MSETRAVKRTETLGSAAPSQVASRLALWLALSIAIPGLLIADFWHDLLAVASPDYVFGERHAAPWGTLALCVGWLWLKRREIRRDLTTRPSPILMPLGLALLAAAWLLPTSLDLVVLRGLLASLGLFAILFGPGARLPAVVLAIYGFAVSFPLLIQRFAEEAYASTAVAPLLGLLSVLGLPIASDGARLLVLGPGGGEIALVVTAACAGPATMAVFVALFALMTLDVPLPERTAVALFLVGVVGTWLQSLLRLAALVLSGHYFGEDVLWTLHGYTIYLLFPLWYLIFAWLYFRLVGSRFGGGAPGARTAACRATGGGHHGAF